MSAVSDATPQEPGFDLWGTDMGPAEGDATARRGRRLQPGSSWLNLGMIGVCTALVAAMIVHFATASAPSAGGATVASPQAVANAINLRLSDLPGFRVAHTGGVSEAGNPGAQFRRCFGTVSTASISGPAGIASPDFVTGTGTQAVSLGSTVSVASTSALAQDASLARDPRFPQCFADAVAAITLSANGIQLSGADPTATTLPAPVAATSTVTPILAMRARLTWSAVGVSIPVTVDAYLVAVGHDEITLFAFSSGQPFPAAREQQLVSLLVRRALATRS